MGARPHKGHVIEIECGFSLRIWIDGKLACEHWHWGFGFGEASVVIPRVTANARRWSALSRDCLATGAVSRLPVCRSLRRKSPPLRTLWSSA